MTCKVLLANTTQLIQISIDRYKNWRVWKIEFPDGKIAVLFKLGNEWMQRNEDNLQNSDIVTIGRYIDSALFFS